MSSEIYRRFAQVKKEVETNNLGEMRATAIKAAIEEANRQERDRINETIQKKQQIRIQHEKSELVSMATSIKDILEAIKVNEPKIVESTESELSMSEIDTNTLYLFLRWGNKVNLTSKEKELTTLRLSSPFYKKLFIPSSFVYEDFNFISLDITRTSIGFHYSSKTDETISADKFIKDRDSIFPLLVEAIKNPSERRTVYELGGTIIGAETPLYWPNPGRNDCELDKYGRRHFWQRYSTDDDSG